MKQRENEGKARKKEERKVRREARRKTKEKNEKNEERKGIQDECGRMKREDQQKGKKMRARKEDESRRPRQARKARWQAWWEILGLEKGMTWIFHNLEIVTSPTLPPAKRTLPYTKHTGNQPHEHVPTYKNEMLEHKTC